MNAPLILRPPVRLAIAASLKPALVEMEPAAYAAFVNAKRYAESALSEFLVIRAIPEALMVLLGNAALVICFDRLRERYFIAGFAVGDFDPPSGPGAWAAREARRELVDDLLLRLGLSGMAELVAEGADDSDNGVVIDIAATPASSIAACSIAALNCGTLDSGRPTLAFAVLTRRAGGLLTENLPSERRPRLRSIFLSRTLSSPLVERPEVLCSQELRSSAATAFLVPNRTATLRVDLSSRRAADTDWQIPKTNVGLIPLKRLPEFHLGLAGYSRLTSLSDCI